MDEGCVAAELMAWLKERMQESIEGTAVSEAEQNAHDAAMEQLMAHASDAASANDATALSNVIDGLRSLQEAKSQSDFETIRQQVRRETLREVADKLIVLRRPTEAD